MKKRKDLPMSCRVANDVLTIEIGINTLAFSALCSPFAWDMVGAENHSVRPDTVFRIDDKQEFAREVASELNREAEDGSSLLTELFDRSCQKAIEEGSIAFVDTRDEP